MSAKLLIKPEEPHAAKAMLCFPSLLATVSTVYTQVIELPKTKEKPHPVKKGHPSPILWRGTGFT